jgi:zinc protease
MFKRALNTPTTIAFVMGFLTLSLLLFPVFTGPSVNDIKTGSLLFQGSAFASAGTPVALDPWPHEKSDIKPDPGLIHGTLPNGFRYILMENENPKNRVSMHLDVQIGSMHETREQQGWAHFLEHMMFNGSTHFPPGELVKYFQKIGMDFGADANAHTGFYETVYDILLPGGDPKSIDEGLLVMRDYASGALLLDEEIKKERKVVLAEKRTRDSASYRTFVETLKFEFPHTRFSQRLPIGKDDTLVKCNSRDLKQFYTDLYGPASMTLVMVGNFDSQRAARLIEKRFQSMEPKQAVLAEPEFGEIDHRGIKTFYHYEKEAGHTTVSIENAMKRDVAPDSQAFQKKRFVNDVADRIVDHRLQTLLKNPETPFTDASIGSGVFLKQVKFAEITADTQPENWRKTLSTIEEALRQALLYGFTESELQRVKKDMRTELDNAVNSASTRKSQMLARMIIQHHNAGRVFMSPLQEKQLFTPILDELTLKNVHQAFKHSWADPHRLILVTGNADISDNKQTARDTILAIYEESHLQPVKQPVENSKKRFPYLQEPTPAGRIIHRKDIDDLGIVQVEFENGLRLNLKKTDFQADDVRISLRFGCGRSCEPSTKPGLSTLSSAVINESGLGQLDRDDLEHALAGTSISITFMVAEDAFFFKGGTVSGEIIPLFQLLHAHFKDQGYRPDAFALTMKRFEQKYLKLNRSIDGSMVLEGQRFLAGGDSRFGFPPFKKFSQLTLEEIRTWIEPQLAHAPMELSVVGDFDTETVVAAAARYLGTLPARNAEHPVSLNQDRQPRFPAGGVLDLSVNTKIPKALLVIAYPTEDLWDIKRTRRLNLLASVFSNRLHEKIREELGAAYSPFAFNKPGRAYPGYGVLQAFIQVSPEATETVATRVKQITAEMARNGITQEELQRALIPTLTSIKDTLRQNGYWLNTVLSGSVEHPEQLEWNRSISEDHAKITAAELSILARKYLDNSKSATIIVVPETNIH